MGTGKSHSSLMAAAAWIAVLGRMTMILIDASVVSCVKEVLMPLYMSHLVVYES